jgi:hypothetical protein
MPTPKRDTPDTEGAAPRTRAEDARWAGDFLPPELLPEPFWAAWADRLYDSLPRRSPYGWRERDWRSSRAATILRIVPLVALLLITVGLISVLAFSLATRVARSASPYLTLPQTTPVNAPSNDVLVQPAPASSPTPAAPTDLIGVWVAQYDPAPGSLVTVHVRVTTDQLTPATGVPVSLYVTWPYGSQTFGIVKTDTDGLATFTIPAGGASGQPVQVQATAVIGTQTVTASTVFVPA